MSSKKTKDIVSIFRELVKYAEPTSASISNQSTACTLIVKTKWSQRDLERSEKTTFSKTYVLSADSNSGLQVVTNTAPLEISNVLWDKESSSGKYRAIVLKTKNKKGEEKQYLEIWNSSRKLKTFDVQSSEKHGKVYDADGKFGCLEWSPTERYLVYIAEKKIPKAVSFFEEKKKSDGDESKKEETVQGDEHLFREDWGEVLVDKHHPVPCIVDVQSGEITVLDNIPNHLSAGQACWAADDEGVVFVGWNHEPYRLGAAGYMQRKTGVYYVDAKNTRCSLLSCEDRAVCSPRFSPDKSKLLYMDIPAAGVHHQCMRLIVYDWSNKATSVVVDIVRSSQGNDFPGLYNYDGLPERCWLHDGEEIVVDTMWRSRGVPVVVNLEKKNVQKLDTGPHKATSFIADVWNDYVILLASAPDQRNHLMVGKLDASGTKWLTLEEEETKVTGVCYRILQHEVPTDRVNANYPDLDYESVLCLPTSDLPSGYKPPLIVCPHGGPHTVFDVQFDLLTAGFCQCGYAVLLVNYRGSLGFGQNSIDSLLGNIGDQDVKDVWAAAASVIESGEVDSRNIFVFGESHGGFLTTHLIGQYPGKFKAASCRNPAIDLTTMLGGTDCLDWPFAEMGKRFEYDSVVDPEMLEELWRRSPLSHVHQVTTPILLMIGKDDRRVPTKQAHQYYRILKARKQAVRFLAYDDNSHPIISVSAESDCFVNIMKWFADHME